MAKIRGFLFLEGLVALLAMTVVLSLLIPQFVFLENQSRAAQEKVVAARLLMEETEKYVNGINTSEKIRDGVSYTVNVHSNGIQVKRGEVTIGFQEN
ncbi:hypothetical protein [Enterococcus timonensis]|uniref:hypothetical protein n=1 Tax=Enterococcus timonensis TaxID=1852364 RepID=UPI0008DADDC2|nr:hypothetical protein [Enterococcus timonensis]